MQHSLSRTLSKTLLASCLLLASLALSAQEPAAVDEAPAAAASDQVPPPPVTGTLVYKSVDKDGKTVFTDMPPADRPSEPVTVKSPNKISLTSGDGGERKNDRDVAKKYTSLVITEPQNDAYFGQEVQAVTLSATAQPRMQEGHTAVLYYDGNPVGDGSLYYTVTELERGTHTVVAKIFDAQGKLLIESDPVQFHVRRTSVLNQHKPQPADTGSGSGGTSPSGGTTGAPPPPSGFGGAKGFGGSGGAGGGKAAGGASGAGGIGGAAPTPGR